jgi:hypothetical protein
MLFVIPDILAKMLHLPHVAGQLGGVMLCGAVSTLAAIIPITLVHGRVAVLAEK